MTPVIDNLRLWREWLAACSDCFIPSTHYTGCLVGHRVWTQWQREKSPMLGMKSQLSGHPDHSLDAILTELPGSLNYSSTGM